MIQEQINVQPTTFVKVRVRWSTEEDSKLGDLGIKTNQDEYDQGDIYLNTDCIEGFNWVDEKECTIIRCITGAYYTPIKPDQLHKLIIDSFPKLVYTGKSTESPVSEI